MVKYLATILKILKKYKKIKRLIYLPKIEEDLTSKKA